MRAVSQKEIEAVLRLNGPERFQHFVKRIANEEQAWGLRSGGWALMNDSTGQSVFPLWPEKVYAELCAVEDWTGYVAEAIPLGELMDVLLPEWTTRGILPGVFPTPGGMGVTPSVQELAEALQSELANYG